MRVAVGVEGNEVRFRLELLPGELPRGRGQFHMEVTFGVPEFRVRLPVAPGDLHPDLAALTALTVARPWSRELRTVGSAVSHQFAAAVHRAFGIEVGPVDPALRPRRAIGRPAISYSGGPDSMGAESLLGPGIPLIHMVRIPHRRVPYRAARHRGDIHRALVEHALSAGEEVHFFESDLEFVVVRPHPTFPQWPSILAGPILMADHLKLASIAYGRTQNGMYLDEGRRFTPAADFEFAWAEVFAAAGLDLLYPTAGISEASTLRLASRHRLGGLSRSCMLGDHRGPCLTCRKCAIKELLRAAIAGAPLPFETDRRLGASPSVLEYLGTPPYFHQYLLEYGLARVPGIEDTVFGLAGRHLRSTVEETAWVDRYYPPALDLLPGPVADRVESRLLEEGIEAMTERDIELFESWHPGRALRADRQPQPAVLDPS